MQHPGVNASGNKQKRKKRACKHGSRRQRFLPPRGTALAANDANAEEKESSPQASSKLCKRARGRTLLAEVGQHHVNQRLAGEHLAFQSHTRSGLSLMMGARPWCLPWPRRPPTAWRARNSQFGVLREALLTNECELCTGVELVIFVSRLTAAAMAAAAAAASAAAASSSSQQP